MDVGLVFGEDRMRTHKCIRCGNCCTDLEPSKPGVPGGLLLISKEVDMFLAYDLDDIIPTVGYTIPGYYDMKILYYGMVAKRCPMYDDEYGCMIYEDRPLVCRRYPFGNDIQDANSDCPVVRGGGVLLGEETLDAMFDLVIRSQEIMATVPKGSILYIYNIENKKWDIIGVK